MLKKLWPVILVAGCAYQSGTGDVVPVGNGKYSVAGRAGQYAGGTQAGQTLALKKANAFCEAEGQKAVVDAVQGQPWGGTAFFHCTP